MKIQRKLLMAAALAAVLPLSGCWDDDNEDNPPVPTVPPVVITEVPDSAGISTASFVSFILSLDANDESSEPLTLTPAFAVPPDDSAEPTPLT